MLHFFEASRDPAKFCIKQGNRVSVAKTRLVLPLLVCLFCEILVPIGSDILSYAQQAETTAEETKARHQNVVVTLDATYREIDEKTRR